MASFASQTAEFLLRYKKLVQLYDKGQFVDALCIITGNQILPSLLFAASGELKAAPELQVLAHQQLSLLINQNSNNPSIAFLLLANIERNKVSLRVWSGLPIAADSAISDAQWFAQRFAQRLPISCDIVRSVLLQQQITDLRFYLTVKRQPRADLALLLRQVRQRLQ